MTIPPQAAGAPGDPSMEDILASIRRILTEDEATQAAPETVVAAPPPAPHPPPDEDDGVLDLSTAMLVPEREEPAMVDSAHPPVIAEPRDSAFTDEMLEAPRQPLPVHDDESLVAPEAAAAAATSVSHLVRRLSAERGSAVYRGGPTIEDVVREEMRPLLKAWLDANLPPLVERLVRAEIERVVARGME